MAWIKRNLFFVIGAIIALALLAAASVYILKNWQRNKTSLDTLNETYSTLQQLNNQSPSPGNDKINNVDAARDQEREASKWIGQTDQHFQSITPIPNPGDGSVTSEEFAAALRRTIDQLQHEADSSGVLLPPQYSFSFEAERSLVRFSPDSPDTLAVQLGEVKEICDILFAAKINSLDNLRRARISDDDVSGPQSDYLSELPATNNLAIFVPYEITFRCFSQDLAEVLSSFASSPDGFILKGINVQPAQAQTAEMPAAAAPSMIGHRPYMPPPYAPSPVPQSAPLGRGGLQTVLNEQLLSVTMEVELVKLLPKK
jgi:hypothetical protein